MQVGRASFLICTSELKSNYKSAQRGPLKTPSAKGYLVVPFAN